MRRSHPSNNVSKLIKSTSVDAVKDNYTVLCGHEMSQFYLVWHGGRGQRVSEKACLKKVIIEVRFKETVGIN